MGLEQLREKSDPGHALAVKNPEAAIRVGDGAYPPGAEWFVVGVTRTIRAHLRWVRVGRDNCQYGVDGGRGDIGVGDVESPPWDLHEVPPTVNELALVGEPLSDKIWLWFLEVVLLAGEVGVELVTDFVGDSEGHGLMPRAGPRHHGLDVFVGGVRGWVVEFVVELVKNGDAEPCGIVQRV